MTSQCHRRHLQSQIALSIGLKICSNPLRPKGFRGIVRVSHLILHCIPSALTDKGTRDECG